MPPSNVTANFDHVKCCIQMQTNEDTNTHELSTVTLARESVRGKRERERERKCKQTHALPGKVWVRGGGDKNVT